MVCFPALKMSQTNFVVATLMVFLRLDVAVLGESETRSDGIMSSLQRALVPHGILLAGVVAKEESTARETHLARLKYKFLMVLTMKTGSRGSPQIRRSSREG